ncbi:hypothetical protein [Oceanospirillum sediminis]|uniref:Uncharacterized protein n=1 Tax=Oceanospirillum sediminis TaxID=2760088 RepID=A0A839INE3_9GAMM|nr:hypothetical protein [Oceanospirillum sediminis]MBB1486214.1 hypothetical protein [Oceanospirillum sediminis]
MSETQFEILQGWKTDDILDGVRLLLTVTEVSNLSELLYLNQMAETYRRLFPVCVTCHD